MPSDQSRTIEKAKFTYSPLGKGFQKQIETIEEQQQQKKIRQSFKSFQTISRCTSMKYIKWRS